ncbi:hypothetical protein FA13DRAFT_493858 [Coprinellus micaceus]|uniref:F-box domain-containing protein n=1 Tax=Coprinellus micaceus TaxID=71717 RepID=A0A4Y7TAZ1_COPMI|nr:hypothetical protein FA13DRAFT_493858 [Coprinellus micaceus]
MALKWSSPVRRNEAGKLLSQIPNELYSRILDYMEVPPMEKPRALTNIALVCRYFSYLTIPRIFDSFIFDGTCGNTFLKTEPTCQLSDRPLHKGLVPRYAAFCRAILANEGHARALATYVRSCRFMLWGQYDWEDGRGFVNCPTATLYLNLFFSALSSMENVTKLEFHWMVVTPELIGAIGRLKNLEHLVLCKVSIDPSCTSDDCNQLSSLRLYHLTVIPTFHIHSSSSEDLCPLAQAFDVSQMKSLVTAVPSSVRVIENSSSPLPLRDLEIMVPSIDVPIRSDLFQGLPHLRRVSLCQGSVSNGAATLSLGEGCIPHLEDLECVPELLKTFVPGRPVSCVARQPSR